MRRTRRQRYSVAGLEQANLYQFFCSSHLHHVGNDEYYGLPLDIEPWQRDEIWRPILASGAMRNGKFRRRYRRALIGLPRDYGKSVIACALLVTIANMEPVHNGQYGLIASSEEQAGNLLTKVKTMCALDPELNALWEPLKNSVKNRETGAEIKVYPYSEAAVQSWHFNVVIADELHVWRDDKVWQAIISGQKSIPNALAIAITTAGDEQKGFLWEWLEKDIEHDKACYLYWLGADEGEKPNSKALWKRLCLPSWISIDDIRDQYEALNAAAFERYVLNRFPAKKAEIMAIKTTRINKCKKSKVRFDFTQRFAIAVDGAVSGDTMAAVCYQEQDGVDVFKEYIWDDAGEDGFYNIMEVGDVLENLYTNMPYRKPPIGVDPARMNVFCDYMKRIGVEVFALKQQPSIMCPASSFLKYSIESGKAALGACPTLADHAGNCIAEENKAYGMRFTSSGSGRTKKKIDAAIAAAMAMYIYKNSEPEPDFTNAQFVFDI